MGKHYVLYIHGVATRSSDYANRLISLISSNLGDAFYDRVISVPLFWGNLNDPLERRQLERVRHSPYWKAFWFRSLREDMIWSFVGDAALYISRNVGSHVVESLCQQALDGLPATFADDDRLHLVTHSWGTVILFDVLFADRWLDPAFPASRLVKLLRERLRGLGDTPSVGVILGTVHTMGSPVALFSLMDTASPPPATSSAPLTASEDETTRQLISDGTQPRTHAIDKQFKSLLHVLASKQTQQALTAADKMAPLLQWRNFCHPGDPVAYPLKEVIEGTLNPAHSINITDHMTSFETLTGKLLTCLVSIFNFIACLWKPVSLLLSELFKTSPEPLLAKLPLLFGGAAHASYWQSKKVSDEIARAILSVDKESAPTAQSP